MGKFTAEYPGGTRNAAVGSVPDGGAGGAGSVSQRKALFRLLIRLEEGQACPLEALITQALSSKIAMKPGDIRDKKELAEELRLAAEKKLSSEAKTEAPRQTESGGVMKIMKIVGLIALIVCALNRFFHFF